MSEWQQIKTMPEGVECLTYAPWKTKPLGFSTYKWTEIRKGKAERTVTNERGTFVITREQWVREREWSGDHTDPSHWMAIPEPPK